MVSTLARPSSERVWRETARAIVTVVMLRPKKKPSARVSTSSKSYRIIVALKVSGRSSPKAIKDL
jgi:hypothetical protein